MNDSKSSLKSSELILQPLLTMSLLRYALNNFILQVA